jgi:ABC-2 type transport system permease protein
MSAGNRTLIEFFYENTHLSSILLLCPIISFLVFIVACVSLFRK